MSRDDAYDTIARFLSNSLNSDDDRAEYLSLLDELYSAPPALAAQPSAELTHLTAERLRDALVASRIISPEAVQDPDGYDDGLTLFKIEGLHRRLAVAQPSAERYYTTH